MQIVAENHAEPVSSMQAIRVTSASEWSAGYLLQFPSLRWARVRPISALMLLNMKGMPEPLMAVVEEWINQPNTVALEQGAVEQQLGGKVKSARTMRQLYEAVAMSGFIEPRIVENPTHEGEISPLDIFDSDLEFFFAFLGRPELEIARFSAEQRRRAQAGLEPLFNVQGFFASAEPPVGGE